MSVSPPTKTSTLGVAVDVQVVVMAAAMMAAKDARGVTDFLEERRKKKESRSRKAEGVFRKFRVSASRRDAILLTPHKRSAVWG